MHSNNFSTANPAKSDDILMNFPVRFAEVAVEKYLLCYNVNCNPFSRDYLLL